MAVHRHSDPGRARLFMPAAVAALAVTAILPGRWSGWVSELSRFVMFPTGPLSTYIVSVTRSVLSPPEPPKAEELRLLEERKQEFETLYLREREENQRLRDFIRELQQGLALNPEAKVTQTIVPVLGTSADLTSGMLSLRTGTLTVDRTTVATTSGLQLVGRVSSTSGPASLVIPITRKGAGKLRVVVMSAEGVPLVGSSLTPVGDGTLRGDAMRITAGDGPLPTPEAGQLVRLDDPEWPGSSRMLIVGRVETVSSSPEDPLRPVVVVRPTLNIERVSEVVLRLQGGPGGAQ